MNTEETDYSSDYESFFSLAGNKLENSNPKKTIEPSKSSIIIQNAARLELESITLKQSISDAMKTFKNVPIAEISAVITKIDHINTEVSDLKNSCEIDSNFIKNTNKELSFIKNELKSLSNEVKNNHFTPTSKQFHEYVIKTDRKLNNLLQTNNELLQTVKTNTQETSVHQLKQIIQLQSESHTKELQEIKKFLTLVLPRIINLENSLQQLVKPESTSHTSSASASPSASPSNSRKISTNKNTTKKRRLI